MCTSWALPRRRQNSWKIRKGAVLATLLTVLQVGNIIVRSIFIWFLNSGREKTLLRGSWYAHRAPGDSLILQVFWQVLQIQLVCIPHWRVMQTAQNLWPFVCLPQWVSIFPEKYQCQAWLKYLWDSKNKTILQKKRKSKLTIRKCLCHWGTFGLDSLKLAIRLLAIWRQNKRALGRGWVGVSGECQYGPQRKTKLFHCTWPFSLYFICLLVYNETSICFIAIVHQICREICQALLMQCPCCLEESCKIVFL